MTHMPHTKYNYGIMEEGSRRVTTASTATKVNLVPLLGLL